MTVPPTVPALLKVSQAAAALNMPTRSIQQWCERGTLRYVQPTGRCGGRLIPAAALAELADRTGLPADWSAWE